MKAVVNYEEGWHYDESLCRQYNLKDAFVEVKGFPFSISLF